MISDWQELEEKDKDKRELLLKLVNDIVPYHMEHNAEAEAADTLMEIEKLGMLEEVVDESAFPRVCLYLMRYIVDVFYLWKLHTSLT